jgi:glycosyltransferase involved in cell wall biosynthesis
MKFDGIKLSVVIPITRMSGKLQNLEETLRSSHNPQTQMILVHDIQDEGTGPELLDLIDAINHPNLFLIEGKYGSAGLARNAGLSEAKGQFVIFLDGDDIGKLDVLEGSLEESDQFLGAIAYNFSYSRSGHTYNVENSEDVEANLDLAVSWPGIWRWIFVRSQLKHEFSDLLMGEDQLFLIKNLSNMQISFKDLNIYTYFIGGESQATSSMSARKLKDLSTAREAIKEIESDDLNMIKLKNGFITAISLTLLKYGNKRSKLGNLFFLLNHLPEATRIISTRLNITKRKSEYVLLTGGLGNQLFQYQYLLSLASREKKLINIWGRPRTNLENEPELTSFRLNESIQIITPQRDTRFVRKALGYCLRSGYSPFRYEVKPLRSIAGYLTSILSSISLGKMVLVRSQQDIGFYNTPSSKLTNLHLGYFQTYKWSAEDNVRTELQQLRLVDSARINSYIDIARIENPIVVHFRFGDYLSEDNFGIPGIEYYREALASLDVNSTSERKLWIFSDDINRAKEVVSELVDRECRYFSGDMLSSAETLEVMRLGTDYVMANSTFSWWAAYLSHSKDARIVAPIPWFKGLTEPTDLIPPNWIRIPAYFSEVN